MHPTLRPVTLTTLAVALVLTGVACQRAPEQAATPSAEAPAPATPAATVAPENWISYDDTTYAPVVDAVSRHLNAARTAFDVKDQTKAAAEMRAVAEELRRQADEAGKTDQALMDADKAMLAADTAAQQQTVASLHASATKADTAAAAIAGGTITSTADLDKVIDRATRADIDRRWVVTDVTTWYPLSGEPQHHFASAVADRARNDLKAAATEIRKATGYLRLEAGRATGDARQVLDSAVVALDTLAASVETGTVKDERAMATVFAKADRALALAHRARAADAWARHEYDTAGHEIKAAAAGLDDAAGWMGGEAKAAASATVADSRALGDRLIAGGAWTREEVGKGFETLGHELSALGEALGGSGKRPTTE